MKQRKNQITNNHRLEGLARPLVWLACATALNLLGCSGQEVPENLEVRITAPVSGTAVGMEGTVIGEVSDPKVQVHVLVHPMTSNQWWVQRPPTAGRGGAWKTIVFFGTKTEGVGEEFEILALATRKDLKDGQTIEVSKLPSDGVRTDIVTVTRQH